MATIYTSDSLRNIFQSSFNLAQWYSFSQHFFNASELKEKPERIIENTSDEGYYLGNINISCMTHDFVKEIVPLFSQLSMVVCVCIKPSTARIPPI